MRVLDPVRLKDPKEEYMQLWLLAGLIENAQRARLTAYAPYSKFMVGAAILTKRGDVYAGSNLECADYDGTHAEEAALCLMNSNTDRTPTAIVIVGGLEDAEPRMVLPCGKCRQKLKEFASLSGEDIQVVTGKRQDGTFETTSIHSLLPISFGPADIGIDLVKYRR